MATLDQLRTNPVVVETGQPENAGLVQGLAEAVQVAGEVRDRNVIENARDNMENAALDVALTNEQDDTNAIEHSNVRNENPELVALHNRLARLQAQEQQGNSSLAALARLNMQRELEKATARHPSLRQELEQTYGAVLRTSPAVTQVGLADQAQNRESATAKQELDRIRSFSYGNVANGGLGINPAIEFNSPQYLREYMFRSTQRDAQQKNTLLLDASLSAAEFSAMELDGSISQLTEGPNSVMAGTMRELLVQSKEISGYIQAAQKGNASQEQLEAIGSFQEVVVPEALAQIELFIGEMEAMKNKMSSLERNTDLGKANIQRIDSAIASVSRYGTALERIQEQPNLVRISELEDTLRTWNFRSEFPDIEEATFRARKVAPLLELVDDVIGPGDQLLRHHIGEDAVGLLAGLFGTYGNDGIAPSGQSVTDIRAQARARVNDSQSFLGGAPPASATDATLDAVGAVEATANRFDKYLDTYLTVGETPNAGPVSDMLESMTSGMAEVNLNGNATAPQDLAKMQDVLTSDSFLKGLAKYREIEDQTPRQEAMPQALGQEVLEYFESTGGTKAQLGRLSDAYNGPVGGTRAALSDIITPDFEELDKGRVRFTIDRDALARAMDEELRRNGVPFLTDNPASDLGLVENKMRQVQNRVTDLEKLVERELRFSTTLSMLRNPAIDRPRYINTYNTEGFNSVIRIDESR